LIITTAYPERVADLGTVYVGTDPYDSDSAVSYTIATARRHRNQLLVRLEGVDTRDEADLLRGKLLMVALDEAIPLEDDEYYLFQVVGARVVTTDGEDLGRVAEILETGANDVFVIQGGPRGEILLPDIDEVVLDVDVANGLMTVSLLPGLLPD
jgi:16S rRNA processing protein RimM